VLEDYSNVSPAQVIEAAMFVGGAPLTARKIVGMLRGSFDTAFVEQTIEDLNSAYLAQARPYEIRHGEGGYRLELRPEYDRLRHRVYGSGPRDRTCSKCWPSSPIGSRSRRRKSNRTASRTPAT
jgi:chromosome segregation and condensation protein ScpB